jgi:hypothetical protein
VPIGKVGQAAVIVGLLVLFVPKVRHENFKDDWRQLATVVHAMHDGHVPGTSVVLIAPPEIPPFADYYDREAFTAEDREQRLRARGIAAVHDVNELGPERLDAVRSVLVVRTRDMQPRTSALSEVLGFGPWMARAGVHGLELFASERVRMAQPGAAAEEAVAEPAAGPGTNRRE